MADSKKRSTPRPPPWERLGDFDGIVIDGVEYRVHSSDRDEQKLYEVDRPKVTASFSHERWRAIRNSPGFQIHIDQHDPKRAELSRKSGVDYASDIPPKQVRWMQFVESMVVELMMRHGRGDVKLEASAVQALIDGEMGRVVRTKLKLRQLGASATGGQEYGSFDISGPCLIKKRRLYLKHGYLGLRDGRFRSGRVQHLNLQVASILAAHVYASSANPSATAVSVLEDIADEIDVLRDKIIKKALASGGSLSDLDLPKTPNIKTVQKRMRERDPFRVSIGKVGIEVAVKIHPAVRGAPDKLGPCDRIEYDESIVDAITLLTESGIWAYLTDEERASLMGRVRLVIAIAICAVTRIILAMRIYRVGNGDEAVATFRMILEDKTKYIPPELRHLMSWHQHGGFYEVVMDQGSMNISHEARTVLANLDAPVHYARAAHPNERGVGEAIFRTFGHEIYSFLDARTGSNVVDRKNYRPEERASLTTDELWRVLAIGVAGRYHLAPHSALSGRTPAEEWERLAPSYGTNRMPDPNRFRVTFGRRRLRTVTERGVASFGLSYSSKMTDWHYLHGHGQVEIAADSEDLGAISVRFNGRGKWYEVRCHDPDMVGVRWVDWLAACQSQRDLNSDSEQKRRAARRAAKEAIRSIQQHARERESKPPLIITEEMMARAEREIFGKYQHAEHDQLVNDGQLGEEVPPDNQPASPAVPPPAMAEEPGVATVSPAPRAPKKKAWKARPQ
jgi:putative transposase